MMYTNKKDLKLVLEGLPISTLVVIAGMLDMAALDVALHSEEQEAITGLSLDIHSIGNKKIRGESDGYLFSDLVNRWGYKSGQFEHAAAWYQAQIGRSQ